MKNLHYLLLAALLGAIVGVPTWYAAVGAGADAVPGAGAKVLRSKSGRTYVGGGPRHGK